LLWIRLKMTSKENLQLAYGLSSGWIASELISNDQSNFIYVRIKEHNYHLHHWSWCCAGIVLLTVAGIKAPAIYGFLSGAALQDFTFPDAMNFESK